jgi:hypothetical protein
VSVSAHLKRRIGSWYVGVPVAQVADAERCSEAQVRAARIELRKEPELGLNPHASTEPRAERQMTFAEVEHLMRSNRSAGL